MNPLSAKEALDKYFLEARSKLLDIAAILDRIDRGGVRPDDLRLERIRQALIVLQHEKSGRAEQVQQIFSLEYDPKWEKPKPRM